MHIALANTSVAAPPCNPGKCVPSVTMAATIPCFQESSAIADTMPTTEMPSDDANDGVNTAPVCPAIPRKQAGSNLANSGSSDEVGAVGAVFAPPNRRGSSRARNRPLTYPEEAAPPLEKSPTPNISVGKGSTATKSKKKSSKKSSKKKASVFAQSTPLKGKAGPAVSILTVTALAKVRAEKQRIEKEKKQKAKLKSPTGPLLLKKTTETDPSGSSDCKKVAGSVHKKGGIGRRSRRKGTMGRGRRGVASIMMRMMMK